MRSISTSTTLKRSGSAEQEGTSQAFTDPGSGGVMYVTIFPFPLTSTEPRGRKVSLIFNSS